ncbi:MAG: flagellar motor protein MotA [Deltaproteobacteria bacterium]|nr:flagellar motor protein MotA [Deltaproteobacteria bacterium]
MSHQNLWGALLLTTCLALGLFWWDQNMALVNIGALALVVGGTALAAVLSFPMSRLRQALGVAKNAYTRPSEDVGDVICSLLDLSLKSRFSGIAELSREEDRMTESYLRSGLGLLADGYGEKEIENILGNESRFFQARRSAVARVFRQMGRVAPSFGVAGSVAGLIGMLAGIGDEKSMLAAIPLALASTLYGILLQQLVFIPAAEVIENRTRDQLLVMAVIVEGLLAIKSEENPRKVERRLLSFISPAQREGTARRLAAIRQAYLDMAARRRLEMALEEDQAA